MKASPYVGITGFKTKGEIEVTGKFFRENGFYESSYLPMFGFLVSETRLKQKNVSGKKSPAAEDLTYLARQVPQGYLPMMHYHTNNLETLPAQIRDLLTIYQMYERGLCRAVQLNMEWPPVDKIEEIRHDFPELHIVLQLSNRGMDSLSVAEIVQKSRSYDGLVQYTLIDPSGGFGISYDSERALELLTELNAALPNIRIGLAGGFDGGNVESRIKLIQEQYHEPFSIDAQGKLREEAAGINILDIEKVRWYINGASRALLSQNLPAPIESQ